MDILKIINISQIAVSILLMISILLQARGAGLSGTFGGEDVSFSTRRGAEKFLFVFTIILAVVFTGLAVAHLFIKK